MVSNYERTLAGRVEDAVARLIRLAHLTPPRDLPMLAMSCARELGAADAAVWLADHQFVLLVPLHPAGEREPIPIQGTVGGRAFVTSSAVEVTDDDGSIVLWVPLLDGVDRIGVLELRRSAETSLDRDACELLASVTASEMITRGQYTDQFTCARRQRPMSVAAEMQWQALVPNSFSTATITVAAMLEPAYDVGGDCYDYSHDGDLLRLAVLDAVGHDLRAGLVSSLALATYRNGRRSGLGLLAIADLLDQVLVGELGDARFATGQLAELDAATGTLVWINAGHPLPLLIREGRVLGSLECPPRPPFGLASLGTSAQIATEQLQPGDAVLFYSDGVVEARGAGREDFGNDRLAGFLHTAFAAGLSTAETLRRLSGTIVEFHGGELRDDATTLLVQWRPPNG